MLSHDSERALQRLEQLALEQRSAIAANDILAVCRAARLVPDAVSRLQRAGEASAATTLIRLRDIAAALDSAESYLNARMTSHSEALRKLGGARRTFAGYAKMRPAPSARIRGGGA